MPPVPAAEAERGGKDGRLVGGEVGHDAECRARSFNGIRNGGEPRLCAVEAEEQVGRSDLAPDEGPVLADRGKALAPDELARERALGEAGYLLGLRAQGVGAVQAGTGEERLRPQANGSR